MSPAPPVGWRVALHAVATTLAPAFDRVVAYDLEGRPTSWFDGGVTLKRSLASAVVGRRTVDGVRMRWTAPTEEAQRRFRQALDLARDASDALEAGELPLEGADAEALAERLARATSWTPERLAAEAGRYATAYRPIPILPPDQYGAIVLQASFGCSWNRCTYCAFYQDRAFEVRAPDAFAEHLEDVAALLGRSAAARRSIFLADGNALVLSNARLRPLFAAARERFPGRPFAGFVDVFSGERKPADAWRELRAWGLRRVAIGVETGHDPLLAYLNKPGSADEATAFVRTLKEAGLEVAAILMVGAGGRRYADEHLRDSAALLRSLPLGAGDVVYLSPFVRHAGSRYDAEARQGGLRDLTREERDGQEAALREAARAAVPQARIARYSIDEFVY
jgi:radical SAM superfamily enzyme YgiQ (UPF0313 family)